MTAIHPVDLARTLGDRVGRNRVPGDEKAYTDALLAQAAQDRLLWVIAPDQTGVAAASVGDVARITFSLARLSGSAGLIYAMHMSQALTVVRHGGDSVFFADLLQRLVKDQVLVASGTSEKGVGGDIFGSICTIEATEQGWLMLVKESPNISYLDHAGLILVSAMQIQPNGQKSQVLVAADMSDIDLQPGRATGFMGMRGILNRPYGLTASFSPEAIFKDTYPVIARDTMTPSVHIFWAALWSGIAAGILDKAKAYVSRETANDPVIADIFRNDLSGLVDRHYVMNALIRDAIGDFEGGDAKTAMGMAHTARVKRLKVICSDILSEICQGALRLMGLRAYAEEGPYSLSESIRDAMSAGVMISNYRLTTSNAKIERFLDEGI